MPVDRRLTLKATPHNLGLLFNSSKFADSTQPAMQSKVRALPAEADRNARWNNRQEGSTQWR
jgi:hypothetical protein